MKVRFLKSGRWAHNEIARGQFDFEKDQVVDGISESDATDMKKHGVAIIIGEDSKEEVASEAEESGEESVVMTTRKPWSK